MANRLALVMGVGEYGEGFEPLPGSLLDVREMERVLGDPDCGAFAVEKLENPDRGAMESAVEKFFRGRQPEDFLLLYFSGHGDLGSGGMLQQHLHFCGKTSRKEDQRLVEASAMPAEFLKRQMGLSKAKQIVVILDCCYSGAIADLLKKGEGEIDFNELRAKGRVILASSSAAQTSLQEADGLSLYTRYLIEGMTGAAYPGQGQWIVAKDLHDYADRKFEIVSKGGQAPKIIAEDTAFDLPVVQAPKPDASLEYSKVVDRLLEEMDQLEGIEFDGALTKPLVRRRLDILSKKLELEPEVAQQIEIMKQKPYQARGIKRKEYIEAFEMAVEGGCLPSEYDRQLLLEISQDLRLGETDVTAIEQLVITRLGIVLSSSSELKFDEHSTQIDSASMAETASASIFKFEYATIAVPSLKITKHPGQAEDLGGGVTIEMLKIPAGEFMMGSPKGEEGELDNEKPQHKVKVPEFWMGKFQVTQAQWGAIAKLPKINQDLKPDPSDFKGKNLPVESVSWLDAIEFCDRLSKKTSKAYRLPSEAEWEYACRAGTTTPFNFGKTISTDLANYDGNQIYGNGVKGEYHEKTIDVGSFPPNAFGLFDMHGNAWEWCADLWHENYKGAPNDGSAWGDRSLKPDVRRVLRGGSWCLHPRYCRSAHRGWLRAGGCGRRYGFRLVCPLPGSLR